MVTIIHSCARKPPRNLLQHQLRTMRVNLPFRRRRHHRTKATRILKMDTNKGQVSIFDCNYSLIYDVRYQSRSTPGAKEWNFVVHFVFSFGMKNECVVRAVNVSSLGL